MDKLWETASSAQISVGKDLRAQLSEGERGAPLSAGAGACTKVSVLRLPLRRGVDKWAGVDVL